MAKHERLAEHFNQYWDTKKVKKHSIIDNNIDNDLRVTAAEVPAMKDAPAAPAKKVEETSPVLESVEDLGGTVENEVGKKMNLQVRRVIEDAVRRYLGPLFQQLEKAIRPQVEKEVAEQSQEVKQDIKQVVPAITKVEETAAPEPEKPKEMPKAPPAAPPVPIKEAASLEKKAAQSRIEIKSPQFILADFEKDFGVKVDADIMNDKWTIITDNPAPITEYLTGQQADWKISQMGSEISPITQEIPMSEAKIVGRQAAQAFATDKEVVDYVDSLYPGISFTKHEGVITATDSAGMVKSIFNLVDGMWQEQEVGDVSKLPETELAPALASLNKEAADRMQEYINMIADSKKASDPYMTDEQAQALAASYVEEEMKRDPELAQKIQTGASLTNLKNTREEIRVSGNKEEKDMLKIAYHQGESFDRSYFFATEGNVVKAISAARVIPADVQKAITAAEEKGEEAKDIISPEEAISEIEKASKGTMAGFEEFSASLPKLTREADLKREAEWAINEGEIAKVEMPKKGEVIMSVKEDEKEDTDLPSGRSSKVKSYYGRLPSQAVGGQEIAINQQSSVNDKYKLVVQALEMEKEKVKTLSTYLGKKKTRNLAN